jgi:hypothetical protein
MVCSFAATSLMLDLSFGDWDVQDSPTLSTDRTQSIAVTVLSF